MLNQIPFNDVALQDLQDLLDNAVPESRFLEYKQELPSIRRDSDKKEFLADLSAFANTVGGDILYGISEQRDEDDNKTGVPDPTMPIGVESTNLEPMILAIENLVRDGIAPRFNIQIRSIEITDRVVLHIRIPNSLQSPHMVTSGNASRFYARSSAGKYQMDVHQLREAFSFSTGIIEKIRNFHLDRLAKIVADETPVRLAYPSRLVLHLIPLSAFGYERADYTQQAISNSTLLPLLYSRSNGYPRYNLDGLIVTDDTHTSGNGEDFYLQFFRSGVIESISAWLVYPPNSGNVDERNLVSSLQTSLAKYLELYRMLNVPNPVYLFVSMLGMQGKVLGYSTRSFNRRQHPTFDRDTLQLPEVVISQENYHFEAASLLKVPLDALWQASGQPRCPYYDEDGNYTGV